VSPPAKEKKTAAKAQSQRKSKAGKKAAKVAKPKARSKAKARKAKGSKKSGPTHEARERASGLVDPDIAVLTKDPLRVQIVSLATQRPIAPSEFAREVGIPLNVASYHFRELRKHDYLEIVKEVEVRGATKRMHIATKRAFLSDADWGVLEEALRPGVAGQALQDFNNRVTLAMETGTFFSRKNVRLYWAPIDLDEISWPEFVKVMIWACKEAGALSEDTVERRANGESQHSFPATFACAGFPSPTTSQIEEAERKKRKAESAKKKPAKAKKAVSGGKDVRRPRRKSKKRT
jgi:hypothetical protein